MTCASCGQSVIETEFTIDGMGNVFCRDCHEKEMQEV